MTDSEGRSVHICRALARLLSTFSRSIASDCYCQWLPDTDKSVDSPLLPFMLFMLHCGLDACTGLALVPVSAALHQTGTPLNFKLT